MFAGSVLRAPGADTAIHERDGGSCTSLGQGGACLPKVTLGQRNPWVGAEVQDLASGWRINRLGPLRLPSTSFYSESLSENSEGPAARGFGGGQGGEAGASPKRAATAESTRATGKRPAARRVFLETARCLRCSSVTDPSGYAPSSRLAIEPFLRKQGPSEFSDRL